MRKLLTLLGILILTFFDSTNACNCRVKRNVNDEFDRSDAVFIGEILPEERFTENKLPFGYNINDYLHVYRFIVTKAIKGISENDTISIITDNTSCGSNFLNSKKYIVYGRTTAECGNFSHLEKTYWTDACTRTSDFNPKELKELNSIKQ
jgi:hypothetical protein